MTVKQRLRTFLRDHQGVALVEFACVLPVLLLLYLGGYQLADALSCNRKVTITARAVADLTTQNATVTDAKLSIILSAASKIMSPYNISNATVQVSELYTDSNGQTTVYWSKNNNGGGRVPGTVYTLPAGIRINKSYVVVGEVGYNYTPVTTLGIFGPITLSEAIYMNPRVSNSVEQSS